MNDQSVTSVDFMCGVLIATTLELHVWVSPFPYIPLLGNILPG